MGLLLQLSLLLQPSLLPQRPMVPMALLDMPPLQPSLLLLQLPMVLVLVLMVPSVLLQPSLPLQPSPLPLLLMVLMVLVLMVPVMQLADGGENRRTYFEFINDVILGYSSYKITMSYQLASLFHI